ncbi:hypothetical protein NK6_9278 [Bradyrhizobium diazoefficiens]|uniref:Uncharacterized protein n=1 Tax=Bradyrhizobium diazoefficiens TaxID=1355477 RepID=A0A0E4BX82_9BRAD|nr:hypothetical protein NK6_9278 [Bradyrhizobium diazoefficiens]
MRHHRSNRLPNICGVTATFRERFHVFFAPYTTFIAGAGINRRTAQRMA